MFVSTIFDFQGVSISSICSTSRYQQWVHKERKFLWQSRKLVLICHCTLEYRKRTHELRKHWDTGARIKMFRNLEWSWCMMPFETWWHSEKLSLQGKIIEAQPVILQHVELINFLSYFSTDVKPPRIQSIFTQPFILQLAQLFACSVLFHLATNIVWSIFSLWA